MARLQWNGRECVNPPEGWRIETCETHTGGWAWLAREPYAQGALYQGRDTATEAEAKRACEAALLRLGVLDAGFGWVHIASRLLDKKDIPFEDNAVIAVARALAALEVEAENV